jgi:hypothetical protein
MLCIGSYELSFEDEKLETIFLQLQCTSHVSTMENEANHVRIFQMHIHICLLTIRWRVTREVIVRYIPAQHQLIVIGEEIDQDEREIK